MVRRIFGSAQRDTLVIVSGFAVGCGVCVGVGVLWLMVPAVLIRACRPAAQGEQEHDQRDEPARVHGSSIPGDTRECHDCCSMGRLECARMMQLSQLLRTDSRTRWRLFRLSSRGLRVAAHGSWYLLDSSGVRMSESCSPKERSAYQLWHSQKTPADRGGFSSNGPGGT